MSELVLTVKDFNVVVGTIASILHVNKRESHVHDVVVKSSYKDPATVDVAENETSKDQHACENIAGHLLDNEILFNEVTMS